jgi:hypothetical protein
MEEKVTAVILSFGRMDLFKQTVYSFLRYNTYHIEKFIVIDDSCHRNIKQECEELNTSVGNIIEFVFNDSKLGQMGSIDAILGMVTTPYAFYCEEGWLFYGKGFIEKSLSVMRDRPEFLQVQIRSKNDGIINPIASKVFQTKEGVPFRRVMPISFYTGHILEDGSKETIYNHNGFSFNPSLMRMADYNLLGSGGYNQFGRDHLIDHFYRDLGYSIASITNNDADGYVKYIVTQNISE